MSLIAVGITDAAIHALWLIAWVAIPIVFFAWIVHQIERFVQVRMAERFGWKSVLWTGWLGTPVHELSHAAMCILFRHRIDDIQLFEPDLESGRLGYVKHSFRKGKWFEEIGNVFIGIAPLFGGSLALTLLLVLFYPDVSQSAVHKLKEIAPDQSVLRATLDTTFTVLQGICDWKNLFTLRLWVFIYLVLCIGNHMAPSGSDYRGASRGVWLLSALCFGLVLLLCFATGNSERLLPAAMEILAPFFAVLLLALILCSVAAIVTYLVTIPFPRIYHIKIG